MEVRGVRMYGASDVCQNLNLTACIHIYYIHTYRTDVPVAFRNECRQLIDKFKADFDYLSRLQNFHFIVFKDNMYVCMWCMWCMCEVCRGIRRPLCCPSAKLWRKPSIPPLRYPRGCKSASERKTYVHTMRIVLSSTSMYVRMHVCMYVCIQSRFKT